MVSPSRPSAYACGWPPYSIISTTTIATRPGLVQRWLTVLGLISGTVLILAAGFIPFIEVVFPAWVLVLSVHILVVSFRGGGHWKGNPGRA